ncbi:MAG: PH domain-containing protein [Phycisphaerae bacterium]
MSRARRRIGSVDLSGLGRLGLGSLGSPVSGVGRGSRPARVPASPQRGASASEPAAFDAVFDEFDHGAPPAPVGHDALVASAAAAEAAPFTIPKKLAVAAGGELLDGDELVQLTLKPSLWMVPITSFHFAAAVGLLAAALWIAPPGPWSGAARAGALLLTGLGVGRVALAVLQWASQVYVLTNRRVLSVRGVWNVSIASCPLARIGRIDLHAAWFQKSLGLGTIALGTAGERGEAVIWEHIANPAEIYELLVAAIRRSQ